MSQTENFAYNLRNQLQFNEGGYELLSIGEEFGSWKATFKDKKNDNTIVFTFAESLLLKD